MADKRCDSVASQILSFFDALLERDGGGGAWLPALLQAAPRGRARLGELVEQPGWLEVPLAVRTADGRRGAFTYDAAPARELLAWYIDHPDDLARVQDDGATPEMRRLREALLDDRPAGARARAQDRAHDLLRRGAPLRATWWRFEEAATLDCALITDRLALVIEGGGGDPRPPLTPWFAGRSRLVRDLEAAERLAGGRPWGVLLVTDEPEADANLDTGAIQAAVERGAPHRTPEQQAELAAGFLGVIAWREAAAAVGLDLDD